MCSPARDQKLYHEQNYTLSYMESDHEMGILGFPLKYHWKSLFFVVERGKNPNTQETKLKFLVEIKIILLNIFSINTSNPWNMSQPTLKELLKSTLQTPFDQHWRHKIHVQDQL